MNTIYDNMVAGYGNQISNHWNVQYEVTQKIVLAGLYNGGFFDKAAFYGGTCLRIFHGLHRFSEDMDFTLLQKDDKFHLENYFDPIIDMFKMCGRDVSITKKDKKSFGKVESAFLKDNTSVYNLQFNTEKTIKVKIEIDTLPPLAFDTERKDLSDPLNLAVRCLTLPCLFAGKMHALVFRKWKTRVKGRDWYDFMWYITHNIPLDYNHLQTRIYEFEGVRPSKDEFACMLKERLAKTDINSVKADVLPFVENIKELDFWSNDYFLQLADKIIYQH